MAFLRKKDSTGTQTQTQAPSTISGAPAAFSGGGGTTGSTGVSAGTSSAPAGGTGRAASKPSYVSGSQYLEGNRAGAQKLATQVIDPLKQQATGIEDAARKRGIEGIAQAGTTNFNQGYIDKAGADTRTLSEAERANVQQTLAGTYTGPENVDFGAERANVAGLADTAKSLGTVGGINQRLTDLSGGKKYTTGMRNFDAMLMRQDPTLRTQLEAQKGLGTRVSGTIDTQKQATLDAIAKGRTGAAQRGTAATQQLSDIATGAATGFETNLANTQASAGELRGLLNQEANLSPEQLQMMGLTPEEYRNYQNSFNVSQWSNAPTWLYTGKEDPNKYANPYKWQQFQMNNLGVDPSQIGYQNTLGADELGRYNALQDLMGAQQFGVDPSTLTGMDNSVGFNKAAADNALRSFMASGVAKPKNIADWRAMTSQNYKTWNDPLAEGETKYNPLAKTQQIGQQPAKWGIPWAPAVSKDQTGNLSVNNGAGASIAYTGGVNNLVNPVNQDLTYNPDQGRWEGSVGAPPPPSQIWDGTKNKWVPNPNATPAAGNTV